jgi:hypothetical protein
MQVTKRCNLRFLISLSVALILLSVIVFFVDRIDLQYLRGSVELEQTQKSLELTPEQQQDLREQVLNKQFNIE